MKLRVLPLLLGCLSLAPLWAGGARETGDKVVYSEGFETDNGGFEARGPNEQLSLDGIPAHTGAHALTISHRTATWNGPIRDMTRVFRKGRSYKIEVWGRFDQGPDHQGLSLTLQKAVQGQGDVFENIGAGQMIKGEWTKIEVDYSVPRDSQATSFKLYFETPYKPDASVKPDDLITFAIDDIKITQVPTVAKVARKDIPAFQDSLPKTLKFGTAITTDNLNPANIHYDLLRHFNTFVLGNEMKQDATEPREGVFRFTAADKFIQWAQDRGVSVRGHTLLWHQQVPAWLFKDAADPSQPASKELLLARIENHIKTLVSRYKGKVFAWDVVNEAIGEDGQLRNSPYLKIVGSDEFIEKAFRWAHEADPDAKLVMNDFNVEYTGPKQEGFYREVKSLLDRGVPITSVGLQSHVSIGQTTANDFKNTIERFAALGLDVQVTELDMSIYATGQEPHKNATRDVLADQALKYAALFQAFKEENAAGRLSTVMIWGMSDDESWLNDFPSPGRGDAPLLFDANLQPKPAYWAVVDPSKMPLPILKADVYQAAQAPTQTDDPVWALVSARPVKDAQGKVRGTYKAVWTPQGLTVLVRADAAQTATVFADPTNSKTGAVPPSAVHVTAGVTAPTLITVPIAAKALMKYGFDVRFDGVAAWNDSTLGQDRSTENWGTVTLKPMPVMAAVSKGTPKIDGNVDPLWNNVTALPLAVESMGDVDSGSTVKLLWDEGHLYALFEVKDRVLNDKATNPWEQDSVEVFLDQNNAKTTVYEADDGQYRVSFRNLATYNGGQKEGFKSATRLIPGGYRVVMAVPLYAVPGAEGVLYGFDAQVNNADNSGSRVGIRNWVDGSNMGYQDTSGWGVLRLVP
jgi:endo-1,4-beta-xylanase